MKDEFIKISCAEACVALSKKKKVYFCAEANEESISRNIELVDPEEWLFSDVLSGLLRNNSQFSPSETEVVFFLEVEHNKIGNIKVPKPFKPNNGEKCWIITDENTRGYKRINHDASWTYKYGAYKSEEDVVCVSDALEILFKD